MCDQCSCERTLNCRSSATWSVCVQPPSQSTLATSASHSVVVSRSRTIRRKRCHQHLRQRLIHQQPKQCDSVSRNVRQYRQLMLCERLCSHCSTGLVACRPACYTWPAGKHSFRWPRRAPATRSPLLTGCLRVGCSLYENLTFRNKMMCSIENSILGIICPNS